MTLERIKEIGGRLREMADYARSSYVYRTVEIEQEDYEFDLGDFGYRSASVRLENDEYQFDAAEILDDFPIDTGSFDDLADELENFELPEPEEADLDSVLTRMESNGDGPLVSALRVVIDAFRAQAQKVMDNVALSVGPLPSKPLPWPGALRSDVDYTAADFPRRYNPPPGFKWTQASNGSQGSRLVEPSAAQMYDGPIPAQKMVLDNKGRVSWISRGGDEMKEGGRWALWFTEYLGIPSMNGCFTTSTAPLALDANGEVIGEWTDSNGAKSSTNYTPWRKQEQKERALARVKEIRDEYEQSLKMIPVVNANNGVGYDPLTVRLNEYETDDGIMTSDLRLGEDITGPEFGRVLSVTKTDDKTYLIKMNRDGTINEYSGRDESWSVLCLAENRASTPTAVSLNGTMNGAPVASVDYDPRTIPVKSPGLESFSAGPETLRLGDNIKGYGRVLSIKKVDDSYEYVVADYKNEDTFMDARSKWYIDPIDVPDREAVPTALSLNGESTAGAPDVGYDPLTVKLKDRTLFSVRSDELRLGEDITGVSFGRVVRIEMNEVGRQILLNRDGKERRITYSPGGVWSILPLDVPDRFAIPTAISLAEQQVPAPF